nr:ribonuclease H-like domain-containing protein [Tanacetum cinerariifolium]
MSTQQDIYAAGFESHPPMLNKENYVPWSSRLLRYAKSVGLGCIVNLGEKSGSSQSIIQDVYGGGCSIANLESAAAKETSIVMLGGIDGVGGMVDSGGSVHRSNEQLVEGWLVKMIVAWAYDANVEQWIQDAVKITEYLNGGQGFIGDEPF